jgi:Flp pilus assembly protein TadG
MSARLRAFRFLSDRFAQRERPNYAIEFILFALIVLTAASAMFSLAHAMSSLAHAMSLTR